LFLQTLKKSIKKGNTIQPFLVFFSRSMIV